MCHRSLLDTACSHFVESLSSTSQWLNGSGCLQHSLKERDTQHINLAELDAVLKGINTSAASEMLIRGRLDALAS